VYAALDCRLLTLLHLQPVALDSQGAPVVLAVGPTVLQPQLSDCVVGAVTSLHLLSLSPSCRVATPGVLVLSGSQPLGFAVC
jgi:hypothetical protein